MDGENPKNRARQHRLNKKKYNKNKAATTVTAPKPKNFLESNWDRYEQEEQEEIRSGSDFSVLANAPLTSGSHFQFKSHKNEFLAEASDETVNNSALFNLNLQALEKSLSKLPIDLLKGIKTGEDEKDLNYLLELHKQIEFTPDEPPQVFFGSSCNSSDSEDSNTSQSQDSEVMCSSKSEKNPVVCKNDDENLEQWLDEILDE